MSNSDERYPCPCCSYLVFAEAPGSYDICPICFWEDDAVQLRYADSDGGANRVSLLEGQRAYAAIGASEGRFLTHVRQPTSGDWREAGWRPLDADRDNIEPWPSGAQPAQSWPDDFTKLYYWRDTYWRR